MKEEILKLRKQGLKPFEIAAKLGCHRSTVTYHCNNEYRLRHVKKHQNRREKIKQEAVAYKGGKCQICGYDKCLDALDFHHIDPSQKDWSIKSSLMRKSLILGKLKPELDKCALVCCRCHREIHAGILTFENGAP